MSTEMGSFTIEKAQRYVELEKANPSGTEPDPVDGIVFYPNDKEIITILNHKKSGGVVDLPISDINIYDHEPPQIPRLTAIQAGGKWWYFFCLLKRLDETGKRFSRSTPGGTGYWKATGDPVKIKARGTGKVIGERRTLVFHERHRGDSNRRYREVGTNWVMREYSTSNNPQDLVLSRIKQKKQKKRHISTKNGNKQAKKSRISAKDKGQPNHYVDVDNGNHVAGKSALESELQPSCHVIPTSMSRDVATSLRSGLQLQPSCNLISNSIENAYRSVSDSNNHAIEDTSQVDPYPLVSNSNNHDIEDTSQVEQLPTQNPNELNGSTGLDQTSFPTLQSPNFPEHESSYSGFFTNENGVCNSLGGDWDNLAQFALFSPDEFPHQFLGEESRDGTYSSFVTSVS